VLGTAVVRRKDPLGLQDLLALVEMFTYTGRLCGQSAWRRLPWCVGQGSCVLMISAGCW
jgi:hypothetical protein